MDGINQKIFYTWRLENDFVVFLAITRLSIEYEGKTPPEEQIFFFFFVKLIISDSLLID